MLGAWIPGGSARLRKERINMTSIATSKNTGRRLAISAALLAAVSFAVAPGTAYAQHRGGGGTHSGSWSGHSGNWHGGSWRGGWHGRGWGWGWPVVGGLVAGAAIASAAYPYYYGYPYSYYGYPYPYYGYGYPYYGY